MEAIERYVERERERKGTKLVLPMGSLQELGRLLSTLFFDFQHIEVQYIQNNGATLSKEKRIQ
jgi:transcriptional regulatory protein LevR